MEWNEYTTENMPTCSGEYLRTNGSIVESLHFVKYGDDGWWENDEGSIIDGTTHWMDLPSPPEVD
jgi:hypothetical protein